MQDILFCPSALLCMLRKILASDIDLTKSGSILKKCWFHEVNRNKLHFVILFVHLLADGIKSEFSSRNKYLFYLVITGKVTMNWSWCHRNGAISAWFIKPPLFPESLPQQRMWKGSLIAVNFWGIVTSSASSLIFFQHCWTHCFVPPTLFCLRPFTPTHCMRPTATVHN